MAAFKNEQRRLKLHGRDFTFISYEAQEENVRRQQVAIAASWYLVQSCNRWPAIPIEPGQPEAELDAKLTEWLAERVTS